MFEEEDNITIGRSVTKAEVKETLRLFVKDKSPGLDGWTVEFYSHFFDLLGQEITEAVTIPEESL